MNRHTGTSDTIPKGAPKGSTPKKQPQPNTAQPARKPTHSAKNQRSQQSSADTPNVEGEGSYTATHRYNEGLQEHIQNHDVEREAEEAREALEGDERQELEQAEARGKSPAKR
ncbi:MAG: hypothetical protein ABI895_01970 [Deltaproteobacteria bacterium]